MVLTQTRSESFKKTLMLYCKSSLMSALFGEAFSHSDLQTLPCRLISVGISERRNLFEQSTTTNGPIDHPLRRYEHGQSWWNDIGMET
jgi:hypothetical protein